MQVESLISRSTATLCGAARLYVDACVWMPVCGRLCVGACVCTHTRVWRSARHTGIQWVSQPCAAHACWPAYAPWCGVVRAVQERRHRALERVRRHLAVATAELREARRVERADRLGQVPEVGGVRQVEACRHVVAEHPREHGPLCEVVERAAYGGEPLREVVEQAGCAEGPEGGCGAVARWLVQLCALRKWRDGQLCSTWRPKATQKGDDARQESHPAGQRPINVQQGGQTLLGPKPHTWGHMGCLGIRHTNQSHTNEATW
eukprot:349781-Chlamydomonas_euryale.AAC.1